MSRVADALLQLSALEPIKTWSIIVTLLGDLEQPSLSGKEIGRLLGHVGIKPEATRVALHRLKKDGWIVTDKNGREVIYALSASGLDATTAAYDDVFRSTPKYRNGWKLVIVESDEQIEPIGEQAIRLLRQVFLIPTDTDTQVESALEFDFSFGDVPAWIVNRIVPADVVTLAEKLNELAIEQLHAKEALEQIDSSALRLLFLHRWRKMALRENTWAHIGLFPDGALAQCQSNVTQLLASLGRE